MKIVLAVIVIACVAFYFFSSIKNTNLAKENIQSGKLFLSQNKEKPDVFETNSGLQYQILHQENANQHPSATDTVKVHYHGTLINGTVFDSSVERGDTISFPLNGVIKGWTEGLQLMSIGDKYRFFIPSDLAYGNKSIGKIPGGSVLIFDVELFSIN